jgi:hypothetical protein
MPKKPKPVKERQPDPTEDSQFPPALEPNASTESAPPIVKYKVMGKSQFGPVQTDNKQKP